MSALDALDEQQRQAALALRGPVAIIAGAGTGKTRTITQRIAHGVDTGAYSPSRVMALTFTSRAAGELRGRLRDLGVVGVSTRTFHATALAQLGYFWPVVAGHPAPSLLDNKVRLLGQVAESFRIRADAATLRDVAAEIEWRKVSMLSIEQYAVLGRGVGAIGSDALVELHRRYEAVKDERHRLDFEDVLLACAGMIEAEPHVAAAIHEQYRYLTVDEYQDISPLQNRLLELWLGERRDLCVVGDPSQTIYSFAGAQQRFLLEFSRRYPDAQMLTLERNYRSMPAVLDVANALMQGRQGAVRLNPANPELRGEQPTLAAVSEDREEAECVALAIEHRLAAGAAPSEIAVLYRAHAQSAEIQVALSARGIVSRVLGGARFFDLPEVRQAVLALRAAAVAPTSLALVPAVRDVLLSLGFSDEAPAAGGALRSAWEARRAILQLAEDAAADTTLRSFADTLMARAKDQHELTVQAVTLSTLHASKGLEWAHVYLMGLAEGLLPISYAQGFEAVDEERRLAYVGITRARTSLSLSWAAGRTQRAPSRFIQEIGTVAAGTGALREITRREER